MDEIERKTRLGFRENFGNFLEKICGGAEERERRLASIFGFLRVASNFRLPIASV